MSGPQRLAEVGIFFFFLVNILADLNRRLGVNCECGIRTFYGLFFLPYIIAMQ